MGEKHVAAVGNRNPHRTAGTLVTILTELPRSLLSVMMMMMMVMTHIPFRTVPCSSSGGSTITTVSRAT